jgi:hypothetical protein
MDSLSDPVLHPYDELDSQHQPDSSVAVSGDGSCDENDHGSVQCPPQGSSCDLGSDGFDQAESALRQILVEKFPDGATHEEIREYLSELSIAENAVGDGLHLLRALVQGDDAKPVIHAEPHEFVGHANSAHDVASNDDADAASVASSRSSQDDSDSDQREHLYPTAAPTAVPSSPLPHKLRRGSSSISSEYAARSVRLASLRVAVRHDFQPHHRITMRVQPAKRCIRARAVPQRRTHTRNRAVLTPACTFCARARFARAHVLRASAAASCIATHVLCSNMRDDGALYCAVLQHRAA